MGSLLSILRSLVKRHRAFDFDYPDNWWEELTWFVRWPIAVIVFGAYIFAVTTPFHLWRL